MSGPLDDREDAEHDAWLRAALRHAPDAELGAPPALSAAILREAGAARTAAHRSAWQRLREAWSWLARPPVAAGFASVMVATVVGLMWWDRPLEEAPPRMADTQVMAPTAAAPASAPVASVAVAPPPVVVAEAAPAAEKARADAPRPQSRPLAETEARERAADAAAPARAMGGAQSERAEQASVAPMAEPEAARKMAAPAALADAAAPPTMEAARRARTTAAPAASPAPVASWRADILAQPQHWTWQLDKGRAQAMTPAVQAWLARVDDVLAGATLPSAAVPEGTLLQLLHDGRPHSWLILGDTGLWLLPAEAGRAPLSAALSPESAVALKAALDEALR